MCPATRVGQRDDVGFRRMADTWPDTRQTVVIDHGAVQHENALLRELVDALESWCFEHNVEKITDLIGGLITG